MDIEPGPVANDKCTSTINITKKLQKRKTIILSTHCLSGFGTFSIYTNILQTAVLLLIGLFTIDLFSPHEPAGPDKSTTS